MIRSEMLGLSADVPSTPRLDVHLHPRKGSPPASWGVAWYPEADINSSFMKDTDFRGDLCINDTLPPGESFETPVFIVHARQEVKREMRSDTLPFRRPYGRKEIAFAHVGDLNLYTSSNESEADDDPLSWTHPAYPAAFSPAGRTDSERFFCRLLQRVAAVGAHELSEVGWERLHAWFTEVNELGSMSLLMSNGHDLIAYRDRRGDSPMWWTRMLPTPERPPLRCGPFSLDFDAHTDVSRTFLLVASVPDASHDRPWTEMRPGEMFVARRGDVVWQSAAPPGSGTSEPVTIDTADAAPVGSARWSQPLSMAAIEPIKAEPVTSGRAVVSPLRNATNTLRRPSPRLLSVTHETLYSYSEPVEASRQLLRLRPVDDLWQEVLEHELIVEPAGERRDYEDVFGNQVSQIALTAPYTELRIRMRTLVQIHWEDMLTLPHHRQTMPLVWMPWQRQMMHAYLQPMELPETQLQELGDYAMSFAERRDYDLVETLIDMNTTIYRDYRYLSGSTTNETTPFEVYTERQGVCQDFANLFICLARMLGIPARYRVGYIHTGKDYENQVQSDATHAWAEAYLPNVGWRGFDPTNGCLVGPDHIRVAVGRNYRDATPTSGTIFRGGGTESLTVAVEATEAE